MPRGRTVHKQTARRIIILILLSCLLVATFMMRPFLTDKLLPAIYRSRGQTSIEQRMYQYGPSARRRLMPWFAMRGVPYPPKRLIFVGLKQERTMQLYAMGTNGRWTYIRSYPILAASGCTGPKLCYGDGQVPEGIYGISELNPNSRFHLSLRVNYPNKFDRTMGAKDGRQNLGGNIMIHGKSCSVGCLAMGEKAAEEFFVLAADTGIENIKVILSPVDFRRRDVTSIPRKLPAWVGGLYQSIRSELKHLPLPK